MLAAIGNIANFPSAAALKKYLGWGVVEDQTGTTRHHRHLNASGKRTTKKLFYLAVLQAIQQECEWQYLYRRLVASATTAAPSRSAPTAPASLKAIGRIAGQMIAMIYRFLQRDQAQLAALAPGAPLPPPLLYDPAVHRVQRGRSLVPAPATTGPSDPPAPEI